MQFSNKAIFLIIGALTIIVIVIGVVYSKAVNRSRQTELIISPTPFAGSPTYVALNSFSFQPKRLNAVPTLNPAQGYGLDLNSQEVKNSINEINKIVKVLPYKKTITVDGIKVDILIPPADFIENEWTLTVHIFGIDYQIPDDDPTANNMRNAFLTAAQDVFYWLKNNNVRTEDIIIQWGDRAFIQDKSEAWLLQK